MGAQRVEGVQEGVRRCERGLCKRGPLSGTAATYGWSSMSEGDCSSSTVRSRPLRVQAEGRLPLRLFYRRQPAIVPLDQRDRLLDEV